MNPQDLEKIRIKRLFKLKGRFVSCEHIKGYIWRIILAKGRGDSLKLYVFDCFDSSIINAINNLPQKTILRLYFEIITHKWNDKYFTSLKCSKYDIVPVAEEKLLKLAYQKQLFDNSLYCKTTNNNLKTPL